MAAAADFLGAGRPGRAGLTWPVPQPVNPSTAFAVTLVDELMRCGLRDAVLAPGSRSAPLAIALWERAAQDGALRLHVRIDERSAAFLALGLAKASGRPVAVVCTSGTAAANFHPAVIEADESGVPLLVLTADRPPELRGTGANQAIDQLKLYGGAVRWFAEAGVPEARPGMNAVLAVAGLPGVGGGGRDGRRFSRAGAPEPAAARPAGARPAGPGRERPAGRSRWTGGRTVPRGPGGRPSGGASVSGASSSGASSSGSAQPGPLGQDRPGWGALDLPWTERGVIVAGDGAADPAGLLRLAAAAGWPVLAEPSSGVRQGRHALAALPVPARAPGFPRREPS